MKTNLQQKKCGMLVITFQSDVVDLVIEGKGNSFKITEHDHKAELPKGSRKTGGRKCGKCPGDALAIVIAIVTLGLIKMCDKCQSRRTKLNELGWGGCVRAINPLRLLIKGI